MRQLVAGTEQEILVVLLLLRRHQVHCRLMGVMQVQVWIWEEPAEQLLVETYLIQLVMQEQPRVVVVPDLIQSPEGLHFGMVTEQEGLVVMGRVTPRWQEQLAVFTSIINIMPRRLI